MTDYIDEVFGADGHLSKRFPNYEPRTQQVELARHVHAGLSGHKHVLGEGPCGSGKGLSYLVPASWHSAFGKRVPTETGDRRPRTIVVTGTIALQQQLVEKDLPLLASIVPWKFTYALLKGRNNFLCLAKIGKRQAEGAYDNPDHEMLEVLSWARTTLTGDRADLPFVPENRTWNELSVEADGCAGKDCWMQKHCFSEAARKKAFSADVVVTNYHMLFLHVALKNLTGRDLVLPEFEYLVADEAHEASDIARSVLGESVTDRATRNVISDISDFAKNWKGGALETFDDAWCKRLKSEAEAYFKAVERHRGTSYDGRLKGVGFAPLLTPAATALPGQIAAASEVVDAIVERLRERKRSDGELSESDERYLTEGIGVVRRATRVSAALNGAATLLNENVVWSIEGGKLTSKLLDVADILRQGLFEQTRSVVAVSATMTVAADFGFIRNELGVPEGSLDLAVASPFDFERQAAFYLPDADSIPDNPNHPEYFRAAMEETVKIVEVCGGRTLVLCTSNKDKDEVGAGLSRRFAGRYRVLVQGQHSTAELSKMFKADSTSVLVGVRSFWTGIDVPGDALTGLVIWRLPISPPNDPILDAFCERDRKRSGKDDGYLSFLTHFIPRAVMMLRQGIGRLVRSQHDYGVVAVLDRRIVEKGYGSLFVDSLPAFSGPFCDVEEVASFLRQAEVEFRVQ